MRRLWVPQWEKDVRGEGAAMSFAGGVEQVNRPFCVCDEFQNVGAVECGDRVG